jgi:hypothetical protein
MYLPEHIDEYDLCGVGFDSEGRLVGQYFVRRYCGTTNSAPDYNYYMPEQEGVRESIQRYSNCFGIVRFTKRRCDCGCKTSVDKCTER